MQIKKDSVKQSLLDSAAKHFKTSGFEKASIRDIVKDADTTIGNFYNYFENKDAIFLALTEDLYQDFVTLIDHHGLDDREMVIESNDLEVWRKAIIDLMTPLLVKLDETFLLLVENENSQFDGFKERLITLLSGHFTEHIAEFSPEYLYPNLGRLIGIGLLSSICEVIRTEKDTQKRIDLIVELIIYFSVGILGL